MTMLLSMKRKHQVLEFKALSERALWDDEIKYS